MFEQEKKPEEMSQTNSFSPSYYGEDERYSSNYAAEKLKPQASKHRKSLLQRFLFAFCSIALFIFLFFLIAGLADGFIATHTGYGMNIVLPLYAFFFLLFIATIISNILYNRKR